MFINDHVMTLTARSSLGRICRNCQNVPRNGQMDRIFIILKKKTTGMHQSPHWGYKHLYDKFIVECLQDHWPSDFLTSLQTLPG